MSLNTIREVVQQNKTFKKEYVMDRLQQSLSSKLEEYNIKVTDLDHSLGSTQASLFCTEL